MIGFSPARIIRAIKMFSSLLFLKKGENVRFGDALHRPIVGFFHSDNLYIL